MALKMNMSTPFANKKSILKGIVAGSLMIAALLNDFGTIWRIILFVGGFLVFLEGLFPYGKELHTGTLLLMTIVGGVISLLLTSFYSITAYVVFIILVGAAVYIISYMKNKTKTWI